MPFTTASDQLDVSGKSRMEMKFRRAPLEIEFVVGEVQLMNEYQTVG